MKRYSRLNNGGKRLWHFFWHEDSVASWIANLVVAFLLIRFIVYPILGIVLGTSFPIVAVVSESMQHNLHENQLCGNGYNEFHESFDNYWKICGSWYENRNITREEFLSFRLKHGFNKGDVIILWRASEKNLKVGDILVFWGSKPQPIIHRLVKIWQEDGETYYQTKGDHNPASSSGLISEKKISKDRVIGKGIIRIPYLGWLKILFVDAVRPLGINIQR